VVLRLGTVLLVLALGGLLPAAADAGIEGAQAAFSAQELARLSRGELVERRITQRNGTIQMMGGTSWQVVNAPPSILWQALLDTSHYHRMLPQVVEAKLVRSAGATRSVFVRHGGGLLAPSYYLDLELAANQRSVRFKVDPSRARGVRAAWGFYELRPYAQGRTLLVYGVMADIGDGLLTSLVRSTVHEWMMKVPWMVKRFVEGSGRYIYK
jgi:hypothetical protein